MAEVEDKEDLIEVCENRRPNNFTQAAAFKYLAILERLSRESSNASL